MTFTATQMKQTFVYFSPWVECDPVAPACLLEIRNRKSGNRLWCTDMNCFRKNLFPSLDMDINYKYFFQFNLSSPIYFHTHTVWGVFLNTDWYPPYVRAHLYLWWCLNIHFHVCWLCGKHTMSCVYVCVCFPPTEFHPPAHNRAELHASFGSSVPPGYLTWGCNLKTWYWQPVAFNLTALPHLSGK